MKEDRGVGSIGGDREQMEGGCGSKYLEKQRGVGGHWERIGGGGPQGDGRAGGAGQGVNKVRLVGGEHTGDYILFRSVHCAIPLHCVVRTRIYSRVWVIFDGQKIKCFCTQET